MGMSLYDLLVNSTKKISGLTKQRFGKIMHDPNATEQEIQDALQQLSNVGGYDNLPEED